MNLEQIETRWGKAALAKKVAHYSRLRVGQLKSRMNRHKKRMKDMEFIQKRLFELGLGAGGWYIPAYSVDPALKARYNFEHELYNTAYFEYGRKVKANLSSEESKQAQLAFVKVNK